LGLLVNNRGGDCAVDVPAFFNDACGASLDKIGNEILWNPGVMLSDQGASFVASSVAGVAVTIAKEIIELFLYRDEKIIVEENLLRGSIGILRNP
jgi:hypothetical protein